MNIIRLFLFLLLIWIVWGFFKRKNKKALKIQEKPNVKQGTMISCKHCGLHIPIEESIQVGDANFCCKEHSQL
ncbi:PP0621 family protein [Candidatus Halobeggiatoa sp. HSG11]|nr:PP0621 family protein [Candidatus Halobeggiatoa sp. HSG11]